MKIILTITSWDFGGAEMQVLELAKEYIRKKHDVWVVSLIKPNNDYLKKSKGIKVYNLAMKKGSIDFLAIFRLKKIIKKLKPDVIHAHMIHAVILTRTTRLFVKIPKIVSTAHSINEGGRIRELMYRYTDFLSDINTNVSQTGLDVYLQKGIFKYKNNSFFIPNGISLSKTNFSNYNRKSLSNQFNLNQSNFIWLAVGRLVPAKDYFNLIEAVNILKNNFENFKVLIAGEGTLRKTIEEKINELKLENNIILLGRRNDISDLLQYADAFVMSSAWEGLPIAILEAATYELPSVVTNVGGCKEIIVNNKNGFIVPPKNPKSLANAMFKMMTIDKKQRAKFAAINLLKIEQTYNIDNVIDNWLTIYNN